MKSIKYFYISVGLNYKKMGFLDKTMTKIATMMLEKQYKSAENIGMQNLIKKSYDISNKAIIKPLVDYIKSL